MTKVLLAVMLLKLAPCHVPGVDEEVRCGRHEVFENRAAHAGRRIALNIVVLPATGSKPSGDPLVFLAGGGVAPATRYAAFLAGAFPALRRQHDILLVDQRGTGGSNPLDCEISTDAASLEFRDEQRFLAAVRRCRQELERKADLRYYTTPIAMDDLDEVRAWLGYERLDLYGASYGTTAAMVYLRQHPRHVHAIALQGVIPLDAPMWLEVPRNAQAVLEQVLSPELRQELDEVLKRKVVDDVVLRELAGRMLYSADRIAELRSLIHSAYEGDYAPLNAKLAVKGENWIPKGIYYTLVCSEFIPRFDARELPAAAAGTVLGDFRVSRDVAACSAWPRGWLPPRFSLPVRSKVPVLVMNGALDHLTPPRYGAHVARTLPNAKQLVLPKRGHNDVDPCVASIIEAFFLTGKFDTSCLNAS